MKKQIIVIIYILIGYTNIVFSQEKVDAEKDTTEKKRNYNITYNTIFGKDNKPKILGYGGPLFSLTKINGDANLLIGGFGGVMIKQNWLIGAYGYGNPASNTFSGKDKNNNVYDNLNVLISTGGLYFEYIHNLNKPIHFSFPLMIGAGVVQVINNENNSYSFGFYYNGNNSLESTTIFVIQPGVNLEFNVSKHFIPAISVSYRYVSFVNDNIINVSSSDFSTLNLSLLLKIGGF